MSKSQASKPEAPVKRRVGRPSAQEAGQKHEAMLEAALEEFSRHGFHGASIRAIAQRAGLSTRTLYNRYADKVALFEACLQRSSLRDYALQPAHEGTLHEQLYQFAAHILGHLNRDKQVRLARIIYRECTSFPQLEAVSRRQYTRFQIEPVRQILQNHGFAPDVALDMAGIYMAMTFSKWHNRVIHDEAPMSAADIEEHAEKATALFLHGALAFR